MASPGPKRADPYGLSGRSAQDLEPPARGSPRDLAIGIDAGEIDGPVWSVSDRATAGAFRSSRAADRKYCRPHARPFRLGFPRDGWSVSG